MKRYVRAAKPLPGAHGYYTTNNVERLFCSSKLYYDEQLRYKKIFKQVFKVAPFYFDDVDLVDDRTQKTIQGVALNRSTYKEFTLCILDHFNISIPANVQAKIDDVSKSFSYGNLYIDHWN